MNIAYIPPDKSQHKNALFTIGGSTRDNITEPFIELRKYCERHNHTINTLDMVSDLSSIDLVIVNRININLRKTLKVVKANPYVKIIYRVSEEQNIESLHTKSFLVNKLFDIVLTWRDDMVNANYFLKYHYQNPTREMDNSVEYSKKKYLAIINSNKQLKKSKRSDLYPERIKAIHYFSNYSEIDLYGMGWDESKDMLIKKVYLGPVESKIQTLKNYKYAIAFENSSDEIGGICEKIFDVMASGCVPIYWGAPNVLDYIPKEAFIDFREFMNYQKLDEYLNSINEDTYNKFITAIALFLKSESYYKFTSGGFVQDVMSAVNRASQMPLKKKSLPLIRWDFFKKVVRSPRLFLDRKRFLYDLIASG